MTKEEKKEATKKGEATIEQRLAWIQFELHAPKGKTNEFGGFKYRSLMDIFQALKPLLKKYGGFVRCTDNVMMLGTRYYVKAIAAYHYGDQSIHTDGYAREVETKTKMDPCQITGTASSYARKYAMDGLFAIDNNKDIDSMSPEDHKASAKKKSAAGKGKSAPVTGNPAINNESPGEPEKRTKVDEGPAKKPPAKKAPPKTTPPAEKEKPAEKKTVSDEKFKMIKQARRLAGQVGPEAKAMRDKIDSKATSCAEMSDKNLQKLINEMAEYIGVDKPNQEEAPDGAAAPENYEEESTEDEEMGM